MIEGIRTIIYPVKDINQARELYSELLAVTPAHKHSKEVTDVGAGKLIASVRDADGNTIGLLPSASSGRA